MKDLVAQDDAPEHEAIDVVESYVASQEWTYDRQGETEILVQVPGQWCDFNLYFAWNQDLAAMHFTCAFDMRVPNEKRSPVNDLLATVNEKLWLGHFGLWREENLPIFRHVLLFKDAGGPSYGQIAELVDTAVSECDRFYPAFQYVVWGGKSAADAVDMAMVDTVGEA